MQSWSSASYTLDVSCPCDYPCGMPSDSPLDQRLQLVVSKEFVRQVDEWRRQQADLPNRSEAIRRLTELGLKQAPKPSKKS